MRFTVDIRDELLYWLDGACAIAAMKRAEPLGGDMADLDKQDIVNAQLLGAAKAAGFGKRGRKCKS